MDSDQSLLHALGRAAREGRPLDAEERRLEALTLGELSEAEIAELERQSCDDSALKEAMGAHQPLGAEFVDRVLGAHAGRKGIAVTPRKASRFSSRRGLGFADVAVPLAIAAATVGFWISQDQVNGEKAGAIARVLPAEQNHQNLKEYGASPYTLELERGVRFYRGETADTEAGTWYLSPTTAALFVLRPREPQAGPVSAMVRANGVAVPHRVEDSESGSLRITLIRTDELPAEGELEVIVRFGAEARRENGGDVDYPAGRVSGPGWQRFLRRFERVEPGKP